MAKQKTKKSMGSNTSSSPSFEQTLWAAADKLRTRMGAVEYRHRSIANMVEVLVRDCSGRNDIAIGGQQASSRNDER